MSLWISLALVAGFGFSLPLGSAHADNRLTQADPVTQYVQRVLSPVLRGPNRHRFARITQSQLPNNKGVLLRIVSSADPSNPALPKLGHYEIRLLNEPGPVSFLAPDLIPRQARAGQTSYNEIHGSLSIPSSAVQPNAIEALQGQLRSLFRADPLLFEQMTPPVEGARLEMSGPQRDVRQQMSHIERRSLARGETPKMLVFMPTGLGKTVVLADYIRESVSERRLRRGEYQIIFVVQNNRILNDAKIRLCQILGLNPDTDVLSYYEGIDSDRPFDPRIPLVMINRTVYHAKLSEIRAGVAGSRDVARYHAIDETHGVGTVEGQYEAILDEMQALMSPEDRFVGMTATPWRSDGEFTRVLRQNFNGNVAAAFTEPEEIARLVDGQDPMHLARLMLIRGMAQGYLSPIYSFRVINYLDDNREVSARRFLNQVELSAAAGDGEARARVQRDVQMHVPLLRKILSEIRANLDRGPDGRSLTQNRGIIFVPSIAHANIYAFLLDKMARDSRLPIGFKAYHSDMGPTLRDEIMQEFRDMDDTRTPIRHRYLVAVRAISEGLDVPEINHLIMARNYSVDIPVAVRQLLQQIGRGTRTAYGKTRFTISDFSGAVARILFEDISGEVTLRAFVRPSSFGETPGIPRGGIFLDYQSLDLNLLASQDVTVTGLLEAAARGLVEGDTEGAGAAANTDENTRSGSAVGPVNRSSVRNPGFRERVTRPSLVERGALRTRLLTPLSQLLESETRASTADDPHWYRERTLFYFLVRFFAGPERALRMGNRTFLEFAQSSVDHLLSKNEEENRRRIQRLATILSQLGIERPLSFEETFQLKRLIVEGELAAGRLPPLARARWEFLETDVAQFFDNSAAAAEFFETMGLRSIGSLFEYQRLTESGDVTVLKLREVFDRLEVQRVRVSENQLARFGISRALHPDSSNRIFFKHLFASLGVRHNLNTDGSDLLNWLSGEVQVAELTVGFLLTRPMDFLPMRNSWQEIEAITQSQETEPRTALARRWAETGHWPESEATGGEQAWRLVNRIVRRPERMLANQHPIAGFQVNLSHLRVARPYVTAYLRTPLTQLIGDGLGSVSHERALRDFKARWGVETIADLALKVFSDHQWQAHLQGRAAEWPTYRHGQPPTLASLVEAARPLFFPAAGGAIDVERAVTVVLLRPLLFIGFERPLTTTEVYNLRKELSKTGSGAESDHANCVEMLESSKGNSIPSLPRFWQEWPQIPHRVQWGHRSTGPHQIL